MFGQWFGIGSAMGAGAGAAMAVEVFKVCVLGETIRIANTKAANTTFKVISVLFIFPPKLKV